MSKYRITLTVHETGSMSKEDFRKLQEAVDTIATLADLKLEIDATVNNIATHLGFNPQPRRFSEPETYEQTKAKVEALLSKPMETGKHNPPENWHKEIYGHDLPEDEKGVTSLNNQ